MDKEIKDRIEAEKKSPAFRRIEEIVKEVGARGLSIAHNVGNVTITEHGVVLFPIGEISNLNAFMAFDNGEFERSARALIEHEAEHAKGITNWMIERAIGRFDADIILGFIGMGPSARSHFLSLSCKQADFLLSWHLSDYQALLQQLANYGSKERFVDSLAYQLLESIVGEYGIQTLMDKDALRERHDGLFASSHFYYALNCFKKDGAVFWNLFDGVDEKQKGRWANAQRLLAGFDTDSFQKEVRVRLCEIEKKLCKKMRDKR